MVFNLLIPPMLFMTVEFLGKMKSLMDTDVGRTKASFVVLQACRVQADVEPKNPKISTQIVECIDWNYEKPNELMI